MKEAEAGWTNQPPVDRLRLLGITEEGDSLEGHFVQSWRVRASLSRSQRPFLHQITFKDRVSTRDVADEETLEMIRRAVELAEGGHGTRGNIPSIVLEEFRPKTKEELRAEHRAVQGANRVAFFVGQGDWEKADRIIRKTRKKLTDQPNADELLLARIHIVIKEKISDAVREGEGGEMLRGFGVAHNIFGDKRRIILGELPGVTGEHLENPQFRESLGFTLVNTIKLGLISKHGAERAALVSAGFTHSEINALPGLGESVVEQLINLLSYGPDYFANTAVDMIKADLRMFVEAAINSPQAASVIYEDLSNTLRYYGQSRFNKKFKEYLLAGFDVDAILNRRRTFAGQGGSKAHPGPLHEETVMSTVDHLGYFRTLGLDPEELSKLVPEEVDEAIRKAFRREAMRTHPDINGPQSGEAFKRVNLAYQTISDPKKRSNYINRKGEFSARE